jgi:hypothetical protein
LIGKRRYATLVETLIMNFGDAAAHILCSINAGRNQECALVKDPLADLAIQQKIWRVVATDYDLRAGRYASRRQFWSRFAAWLEMGRAAKHPDLKLPLFIARPFSPSSVRLRECRDVHLAALR